VPNTGSGSAALATSRAVSRLVPTCSDGFGHADAAATLASDAATSYPPTWAAGALSAAASAWSSVTGAASSARAALDTTLAIASRTTTRAMPGACPMGHEARMKFTRSDREE
jgi:hypothetical protein